MFQIFDRLGRHPQNAAIRHSDLTSNTVYRLLSKRFRLDIIVYLKSVQRDSVSVDELALYLASRERDVHPELISHHHQETVKAEIQNNQLPLLQEYKLVDYDESIQQVMRGREFSIVNQLHEYAESLLG